MNINPNDYGYLGNEDMTIKTSEYLLLKTAFQQAVDLTRNITYPSVYKEEDGNRFFDTEATFADSNMVISYDGKKLTKEMLMSQELIVDLHFRNIETGVAKSKEQLEDAKNLKVEEVATNS